MHNCYENEQLEIVEDIVLDLLDWSEETDAAVILSDMFTDEGLDPLGPQHHIMVTAALLTAYRNNNYSLDLDNALEQAMARAKTVACCTCTKGDDCSLGLAAAAFLSIVLEHSPRFNIEPQGVQAHSIELRHECLKSLPTYCRIGREYCCKMHGYITIEKTCEYMRKNFGIIMPIKPILCDFAALNSECQFSDCPYFTQHDFDLRK